MKTYSINVFFTNSFFENDFLYPQTDTHQISADVLLGKSEFYDLQVQVFCYSK